jgi:predicted dehydrogenase
MAETLRGGVIGAGVFGGHHARQYARLDGVRLSAVLDAVPERAAALALPLGGRGFHDLADFLDAVDVVTVASPAVAHAGHALAALRAGKPVYVEKPVAVTLAEAEAIRRAAAAGGLVVSCGHQERVIFRAMGLLDIPEQPLRLEALRHGTPSERNQDVSAVLDLMIHDIDLALAISSAGVAAGLARGERGPGGVWDVVRGDVTFDDGFAAHFDVSRLAPERRRTMRVVYPSGEVEIDFLTRTFRNTTPFVLDAAFAETPAGTDPLGASIEGFLLAVRGRAPRPPVTLDEAIRALEVGLTVEQALESAPP